MNKTIISLITLLLIFPISAFSQQIGALEFKGIPIQGSSAVFVSQLEKKGFEKKYEAETGAIMSGEFTGKDVSLAILWSPKTKTVWKVTVIFPEKKSWESLKSEYESVNKLYSQKYTYDTSYEFFKDPYYEGDGYELSAFKNEKAHWITFYKEGIMVEVDNNAKLCVSYENSSNAKIAQSERESNNLDDI